MSKMYTCDEVAERYKVKIITVWDWIRQRKLNAIKLGREYRISEEDLIEFENERKTIQTKHKITYLQQMKQIQKKGGSRVAESVSVLLVSIAAVLTAIDQISIVLTTKKLWRQQQQLLQQIEMLQKELSEL